MMLRMAALGLTALGLAACQSVPEETAQAPAAPVSGAQRPEIYAMFAQESPTATVDGRVFLAPAPAPDSPLDRADRALSAGPFTPERIAQAAADNQIDPFAAFGAVLGADFRADRLPATQALLFRVARDAGRASQAPKLLYQRPRPFVRDPARATCVTTEDAIADSGSYPSGHSALGWAWGLVLVELYPARADALLKRAHEYTESRMVCGVHWSSDVASGRDLGAGVVARLHAEPSFQEQMAAAHAA